MLNIALVGLGTVGAGTVRLLQKNADLIALRAGQPLRIKAVSAYDKSKKRDCDLTGIEWVDDPLSLAHRSDIDVVVELVGGANGIARELAEASFKNKKHFVTANKALLASHGAELARLAEKAQVQLLFEAAVAGGIPIIKTLREGLAGNSLSVIRGIINGTCNYILTRMGEAGLDFATALSEAQEKGYAEKQDPAFDVEGHDAACKLSILAALAFDRAPDLASVKSEGISRVTPLDLQFADELGCRVKLLGVARLTDSGLEQRVAPSLVPLSSPLATINGVMNAVLVQGDFIGDLMLAGRGAGAEPTASAVVADLIDLARGACFKGGLFKGGAVSLGPSVGFATRTYIRLQVMDKPGVVADISAILRDEAISIESLIQRGQSVNGSVPVVLTTHAADQDKLRRAVDSLALVPTIVEQPCVLQIEE